MKMIWKGLIAAALLAALCIPSLAHADEFGEAWIDSNVQHVRVEIDGKNWEDVEYEKNGKRCLVKQIKFSSMPTTIRLIARDGGYKPVDVKLVRKNFKRKRQGRYYIWVYKTKVRFAKASKKKGSLSSLKTRSSSRHRSR
jgi:hypothetical protein